MYRLSNAETERSTDAAVAVVPETGPESAAESPSREFYDFVRGRSNEIPAGHNENGMRLYRHLVYIGVEQMLDGYFSGVRETLGEESWQALLKEFIRGSQWESNFYGDLTDEFIHFLETQSR